MPGIPSIGIFCQTLSAQRQTDDSEWLQSKMTIKRFVKAAVLGIGLVVLIAVSAWLLIDDATLISVLEKRIESVTDTRISHQGRAHVTRTLTPEIELEQLVVEDGAARYRVDVNSFLVRVSLPKLLLGRLDIPILKLGDVRVTVMRGGSGKNTAQGSTPLLLKPVLHHMLVGKVSLLGEGEELRLPEIAIDEISVRQDPVFDTLRIAAQTQLAQEDFAVDLALPDLHKAVRRQVLGFSLAALSKHIKLGVEGNITFDKAKAGVDATIHASANDLSKVRTGIAALVIPGALTADARLAGAVDQPTLSKLSAHWKGSGESDLKLTGDIGNVARLDGLQLDLAGKLDNPRWLSPLLPHNMANLLSADLSARISGAYKNLGFHAVNLHVKNADALDLSLNGQFDAVPAAAGLQPDNIDLHLSFSAPTTQAARALLFEKVPELGAITGAADIRAASGAPMLENIQVKTKDNAGIEVDLSGRIASFPLDPKQPNSGYDLDVLMKADKTSVLATRLGAKLPLSGPANLAYRIEGDTQALALNKINLSAGEKKAVQIGAQGQLLFGKWDLADPLKSVDLDLQVNSKDTASLDSLFGGRLPELGSVSATARLHTVAGKHRFDNLRIQNQAGAPVLVSLAGSAGDVVLLPQAAIKNIQINAEAKSADCAWLNAVFGLKDKIPAIGPFKASAAITGSNKELMVADVAVAAGQKDIVHVTADGLLGKVSAASDWRPQNVDLRVYAESTNSRAITTLLGYHLPELGPIQAQAKIKNKAKTLAMESALIEVGNTDVPVVKATGFVDDLFGADKTRWDVNLHMDGQTIAGFSGRRKLPDLGALVGSVVIDNTDGALGFDRLELRTTRPALLSLTVNGSFDDFKRPETLQLAAKLTARDLQLIGTLFDRDWPAIGPVQMNSTISHAGNGVQFDSTLAAGEVRANAAIKGVLDSSPPSFSGKITLQEYSFPDLMQDVVENARQDKLKKPRVFSAASIDYSWLNKAYLDLSIDIASFSKEKSKLKSAQFAVALKSGHLSIKPATVFYPRGKLDIDLQVDANNDPPRLTFTAYGENINPWQTLDIQRDGRTYDTDLDVDVALTSSGVSLHELVANANGDIHMTMKNGKIRRAVLDMVLVDLVGWTISKTTRETYYDVECGVADYGVNQGVMTTKAFLLDSKNFTIGGEGSIDLGREQIDYVLLPKKKSRITFKADPVKITGALSDPSVRVIPWKSAATIYGGLLFAPYIFVGISAADHVSRALGLGPKLSPCVEYEKQYKPRHDALEK
jgi:hypothetical protein